MAQFSNFILEEENSMSRPIRHFRTALMAGALFLPALVAGCSAHAGYYDPYYHDHYTWDSHERVYYNQWEGETHRQHVDFKKRNNDEQKEYYTWRHDHH
jgi:hypothetical protein